MVTIYQTAQSLTPGEYVSLFRLDATSVGGGIFYFVQGRVEGGAVVHDGIEYQPCDVEFEGFEVSGQGALPTPVIRIANSDGLIQSALNTYGDLLGCELRRVRTFRQHLDDGDDPDPSAIFGPDVFKIDRKTSENSVFVEWELSAAIDQEGKKLPGRQVIRDTCLFRYRAFNRNSGTFDYSKALCPYGGSQYFDKQDRPTTIDKDQPSRSVNCCKVRFGEANPLPFGGFPGVGRVRG
ncbi:MULTISPECIES: phage minor tail protein L [unclassified Ensifer]|uniref:phage minor tail protein L n=1 Tax=unclassified Ensifer TaxID=2633371 RepID=UPI00081359EE|nr:MULTISPECIES: phage minor tail protein L [unclassified Ensifer]OCP21893.1 phage minor tail protein L [Ensifer sp. LC54]OCP23327.1 phage minor tail protein L [Ensifer sp. LC384]